MTLRRILSRIRSAWNWSRKEAELDEEIRFHLSEEADERAAAELTAKEARLAARKDFGNDSLVRELTREVWGWGFIERLSQDVRYGLGTVRRHPGFSLSVILSLALGIGANTAVFSLMDAVMLRTLPVSNPERLVIFTHRGTGEPSTGSNHPIYDMIRAGNRSFSDVLAFWQLPMKLRVGRVTSSIDGQYVTPNYFSTLGVPPALGRMLSDADAGADVAVISYGLWQRRFGGAPDVIGESVVVNGVPVTIVGVQPSDFFGMRPGTSIDVSMPIGLQRRMSPEFGDRLAERGGTWGLCIVGRLRDGVAIESARSETQALVWPWVEEVLPPQSHPRLTSWARVELLPGRSGLDSLRRQFSTPLRVLTVVVALVLLIACANIANLLLARSASRGREIAIRASIGAGRFRLVRQLLTESMVLAALGGIAGLIVGAWAARLLVVFLSSGGRGPILDVGIDLRVLAFTAAVTVVTAMVSGLAPALRSTNLDVSASLKPSPAGGTDIRGRRLRRLLVAGQVGVSLLLLIGAGLFLRSLTNIRGVDPGFNPAQLLTVSFDRLGTGYRGARLAAFYRQVLERSAATPGVRSASLSSLGPLSGDDATRFFNTGLHAESEEARVVRVNSVSPRYFETMGIPLVEGRPFSAGDTGDAAKVAILSRAAARQYFAGRSASGETFRLGRDGTGPSIEVVGVAGDVRQKDLRDDPPRMVYFALEQAAQSDLVLEVRVAGDVASIVPLLRESIASVTPDIPVDSIKTVAERVNDGLVQERLVAALSSLFGLLALSLAAVGLYGVVSYAVTMRTSEIGIRMALGADRWSVVRMVLGEAGMVIGAGVTLGVLAAFGATRALASMLFELEPTDASAYVLATITLVGVVAIAAFIPARRASMIDPVVALRES